MKRSWTLLAGAAVFVVAGLATSAFSQDAELALLRQEIAKLVKGQEAILKELQVVREELNIVKIRCSS